MKKRICFLLPLVFFCCYGNAQPPVYSLSAVPASLKEKASIITHEEDILFEVTDIDRATLTVHKVFTVLSKSGKDALLFNEYSNKIVKLDDAEIKVYDAAGKQVAKYKKKDMFTTAVGEGLVEDGSVTYFEVQASGFPITVEFNYVQEYRGTLFYPGYFIQSSAEAVQRSSYTAKVPAALGLRYKTKNIDLQPVITQEDKYKIYKNFIMGIGFSQLLVILLIILVLFGAGKLPQVMSDLGKGLRSFKDGMKDDKDNQDNNKNDNK